MRGDGGDGAAAPKTAKMRINSSDLIIRVGQCRFVLLAMAAPPRRVWPKLLTHEKLPGGNVVVKSNAAAVRETMKEWAGRAYHRKQLIVAGLAKDGAHR